MGRHRGGFNRNTVRAFKARAEHCHYCGQPVTAQTVTIDHIVPRSAGGSNHLVNLVPACFDCNQAKANGLPTCECSRCNAARTYHGELQAHRVAAKLADDWFDLADARDFTRWPGDLPGWVRLGSQWR